MSSNFSERVSKFFSQNISKGLKEGEYNLFILNPVGGLIGNRRCPIVSIFSGDKSVLDDRADHYSKVGSKVLAGPIIINNISDIPKNVLNEQVNIIKKFRKFNNDMQALKYLMTSDTYYKMWNDLTDEDKSRFLMNDDISESIKQKVPDGLKKLDKYKGLDLEIPLNPTLIESNKCYGVSIVKSHDGKFDIIPVDSLQSSKVSYHPDARTQKVSKVQYFIDDEELALEYLRQKFNKDGLEFIKFIRGNKSDAIKEASNFIKNNDIQSSSNKDTTQKSSSIDLTKYRAIRDPKNTEILKPLFKDSDEVEYAGQKLYFKDDKVYIPNDASAIQKLIAELKKSYKLFSGLNLDDFKGDQITTNFSERIAKCFDKNFAADPNKFPGWITSGKYADDANNYYKSGPDSSLNKEQLKEIYKFLTDNIKKDFESRWWQFTVSPGSVSTSNKALKDVLLKVKKPVSVSVHIDITIMNSKIKVEATTNIHQCIPYGYTVMWLNHRKFFPQNESSIDQIMKLVEQAISKPEAKDELRCKGNNTSKLYDGKAAPKEV